MSHRTNAEALPPPTARGDARVYPVVTPFIHAYQCPLRGIFSLLFTTYASFPVTKVRYSSSHVKGSLLAATLLGIPYLVFKLGLIERISTQKLIQYHLQTIRKGFEEEGLSSVEFGQSSSLA